LHCLIDVGCTAMASCAILMDWLGIASSDEETAVRVVGEEAAIRVTGRETSVPEEGTDPWHDDGLMQLLMERPPSTLSQAQRSAAMTRQDIEHCRGLNNQASCLQHTYKYMFYM
jgi:hypothetical protein